MNTGWPATNPFTPFKVNLKLVYGRDRELSALLTDLQSGHSSALVGGRKIGKTTVLRKLESDLCEKLPFIDSSGLAILPVYVDTLRLPSPLSSEDIYLAIVERIKFILESSQSMKHLSTSLLENFQNVDNSPAVTRFVKTVRALTYEAAPVCYARLAILFDEIGPIASSEWGEGFFSNWRSLLSNTPGVQEHLSAVFSGNREMEAIASEVGSPLANVLTWRELAPLNYSDVRNLISQPLGEKVSHTIIRRVFVASGGHPFIVQRLMHGAVERGMLSQQINLQENSFLELQPQLFESWSRTFRPTDRQIYAFIAAAPPFRKPKKELLAVFGDENVDKALSVLAHTGVVKTTKGKILQVRYVGTLFRTWFFAALSASTQPVGFDGLIYSKLLELSGQMASKYLAAWAIYSADLSNYSGAVSEMRDVVTQVLHHFAPTAKVVSAPGFEFESDNKGGVLDKPTRKQRVRHLCAGRKLDVDAKGFLTELEMLDELIDLLAKSVNEAYGRASGHTHVNATKLQGWRCLKQLDSVLAQLL